MSGPEMTVTVLGCDGSYPGPGGACSGYLLQCAGVSVWLDAGPGSMANLQRHIGLEQVDAIVLSHEHPDHWSDLEGFYVAARYGLGLTGVPVYAPGGLRKLMRGESDRSTLSWREIGDGERITSGEMSLSFSRTDHGPETLAVRVEAGGRTLGYSADSGPAWPLSSLGPDLDLVLCEATLSTEKEGTVQHLSARQAGATARRAGVARLVITHIWPTLDREVAAAEAAAAFGAPVGVAAIGQRYRV